MCATRLHNYCINEGMAEEDDNDDSSEDEDDALCTPRIARAAAMGELGYIPSALDVVSVRGNSMMRDFIVDAVKSNALSRPAHNICRNN